MSDQQALAYYREREAAERAYAAKATDPIAQMVHLELAERYAKAALDAQGDRSPGAE